MNACTLDRQALHVLFSFAQADRVPDVRLAARLLMCSQREMRACLDRLATSGFAESESYIITEAGMVAVGRMRQRQSARRGALPRVEAKAA